ncbi:MAG: T9SS type A sorting domain-containing protein [Bacteroidetes bacterium]|nr:MAG: T9SS type A sorting domain-containing protein [Bacteroidota bacterium]
MKLFSKLSIAIPLFALLIFFAGASSSNATVTTIGAGANTYSPWDVYGDPYGHWYSDIRSDIIYRQAELSAAGIPSGAIITQIEYYSTADNGASPFAFKLGMKNISYTNHPSTTWEDPGTWLYNNASYTTVVGWNAHPFSTPFVYNGQSLLLIQCLGTGVFGYTYSASVRFDYVPFGSTKTAWYDGMDLCGGAAQGYSYYTDRPQIRITWFPPAPNAEITEIYRAGYNYTVPFHVGLYNTFAVLRNAGTLPLTSVDLTLTTANTALDPQMQVLNWTGTLAPNTSTTVSFPNPTLYNITAPAWSPLQIAIQGGASLNGGAYTDPDPAYFQRVFTPINYDIDISNPYGLQPIGDGASVPIVCRVYNAGARPMDADQGWGIEIYPAIDGSYQAPWIQGTTPKINPGTFNDITIGSGSFPAKSPMAPYYITASASFTTQTDYDMLNNYSFISKAAKLSEGTTYSVGGPASNFPDFETAINYLNGGGIYGTMGLPVTFEVRNLGVPYTGSFSLGTYSNPSRSPVIIRPAPGEVVTLNYTLPGAGFYLGDLSGASDVTFQDINFQVFEAPANAWGRMFNLSNCSNIIFDACNFTGVQTGITNPSHAVFYLDQADNIQFLNNHIYYGSFNVYENISNMCRTLDFQGNYLLGASNIGAYLAYDGTQDCGSVNFTGNTISNYGGSSPLGGLHTWNSTVVTGNTFSGITGIGQGQAALQVTHTYPYFYITTSSLQVANNTFNNLTDADGIHLIDVTNGVVGDNNNITIVNTLNNPLTGIYITNPNTGRPEKAKKSDGTTLAATSFGITVNGNTVTMLDMDAGNGILLDNTANVAVTKNIVHVYNQSGFGAVGLNGLSATDAYSSVFAINMVDGQDLVGLNEVNSWDLGVYYNTISVNSNTIDNDYAVASVDGGMVQLYRNIFQNEGYGKVIRVKNFPIYQANQNNFWNTATPSLGLFIGRWYDTDVQIVYTLGVLDTSATMLNWRYYTTPNDEETYFTGRTYYAANNLHLAMFQEDMINPDALFAQVPNPVWPYVPPTLPSVLGDDPFYYSLFENFDIDNEDRSASGFFTGADNLHPTLSIIAQPENLNECLGASNTDLRVSAFLTLGVPIHYQWWKDDVPMTDVDNPNYNKAILFFGPLGYANGGVYRCQVFGFGQDVLWTDPVTVNILAPVEITRSPIDKYAQSGGSVMLEVEAHAFGLLDDPPLFSPRFEWWKIDQNNVYTKITNNAKYSGAASNLLGIKDIDENDYSYKLYAKVFSECNNDSTPKFSLLKEPQVVINAQPQSVIACEGADVQLTVDASETEGGTGLAYLWKHNGVGIGDNANFAGTTTNTLSITGLTTALAGDYKCEITALPTANMKTTDAATVTVNVKPTITVQPVPADVTEGQAISLSVTATGSEPITYQWHKDDTEITGATNSTYTIDSAVKANEGLYFCVVTNDCGEEVSAQVNVKVTTQIIGVHDGLAEGLLLEQNSPNPFNLTSVIRINSTEPLTARIVITDLFGREVAVVFNNTLTEGTTEVKVNANQLKLSTGVYYYTLTSGAYSVTKQMVIVK